MPGHQGSQLLVFFTVGSSQGEFNIYLVCLFVCCVKAEENVEVTGSEGMQDQHTLSIFLGAA